MGEQSDNQVPADQTESLAYTNQPAETPEQPVVPAAPAEVEGNTTGESEPITQSNYEVQQAQAEQPQPLVSQDQERSTIASSTSEPGASPFVAPNTEQPNVAGAPAPAVKGKKKWLVPVIALLAVVLLGGSASAYYFGVYDKPQNVLLDAYKNLSSAKAIQSDSVLTLNANLNENVTLKDIKIQSQTSGKNAGQLDATMDMEYKGTAIPVGGKVIVTLNDSTLYFQLNNVKQAINNIINAEGVANQVPAGFFDAFAKLQDQWVKVTAADIKKNNQEAGQNFECAMNVLNKHSTDTNKDVMDAYQKNPFVGVKQDLGVKNNLHGYTLSMDDTKAKAFGTALKDTQLYKDMSGCNIDTSSTDTTPTTDATKGSATVTVWIDQWSHQLKRVDLSGSSISDGQTYNYSGTMNVTYDPSVTVTAPNGSISLEDYAKRYNDAAAKIGMPDSSSLEHHYVPTVDNTNTL